MIIRVTVHGGAWKGSPQSVTQFASGSQPAGFMKPGAPVADGHQATNPLERSLCSQACHGLIIKTRAMEFSSCLLSRSFRLCVFPATEPCGRLHPMGLWLVPSLVSTWELE